MCVSSGPKDSFPLTHSIFAKFISFPLRDPTVGYLATEKKVESSDRPQWRGFNPTKVFCGIFCGTEFISQGTSQHHDSCLEPVNPWEDFPAQRAAVCHCHRMGTTHMSRNKTSLGLEESSPDLTSQAVGLASGCQLHSLGWQPIFC